MNFKTTILLIVILAGIGGYLFFTRSSSETPDVAKTAETKKLVDVKPEDVQKVSITPASGKALVLDHSESDWKIVEPIQAPAENFAVNDLVHDLVGLESRQQLDADKKASLGLDHPSYTVEITSKAGKTFKYAVGDEPKLVDTLAILIDGQTKPDVVNASLYSKLGKKADTYRRKSLLTLSTDQVKQLAITHKGQTIALEKNGSDWTITEPKKMPADSTVVSDLLFGISGLNAKTFPDGLTAEDAGLVKPKVLIDFSTQAPSTQPTSGPATRPAGTLVKLGGYADVTKTDIYVQVGDGPIATVSASTFDTFNKTALDLRDKKVVDLDPDRVESFSVEIDRGSTSKPAEPRKFTIARRKESRILGPTFSPPPTQPAASQAAPSAAATTAPSTTTLPATSDAATRPTTAPTTLPVAIKPSTQPAIFAPPPPPLSKWVFRSGGEGEAEEGQVKTLLDVFHPLKADKFIEKSPTTPPTASFTVTLTFGPGAGSGPGEYTLHFVDPGGDAKIIGTYGDLVFEADRAIVKDLEGDFKTKKAEPATPPVSSPPPSFLPPGHP